MNKVFFITLILVIFSGTLLLAQEQDTKTEAKKEQTIAMYYFHTSFRCNTCRTVEAESKKAFESLFPEQFKNGTATFQAINIEEEDNVALVEKYQIAGQTLLLVKGDKSSNLTSQGFLYAKTDPDKLKEEIRQAFENL
jgi:hypothetical protein